MFKKSFIVILFILVGSIFLVNFENQIIEEKPDAYEVIKYMNNDLYDFLDKEDNVYLLFDTFKLDSNNFVKVISFFNKYEYRLEEIYPYINPMYQSMLEKVSVIKYSGTDLKDGINNAYNIYMKALERQYLSEEVDKILVNGMRIRMLKIRAKNNVILSFLRRYPDVKFSKSYYGLFKTIGI
ncbi:MAG TPA: hypothetical protein GX725_02740 [Mollicutes bacterium]|jgi:hypothetical protein|nr:hypothetical protein [Mollicutes bacterium]